MRALVAAHAEVRGMTIRDLFRIAYLRIFERDMPCRSLDEDVRVFTEQGNTPKYVITYFLKILGTNNESTPSEIVGDDSDPVAALRRAGL